MDGTNELFEALTIERRLVDVRHPVWPGYIPKKHKNKSDYEYVNEEGKLHRSYGPAYVSPAYNIEEWYKDGVHHRIGGPAVTHKCNFTWIKEGNLHRLGGPAIDHLGRPKEYWIDGVRYSPKEFKKEITRRKRKNLKYED